MNKNEILIVDIDNPNKGHHIKFYGARVMYNQAIKNERLEKRKPDKSFQAHGATWVDFYDDEEVELQSLHGYQNYIDRAASVYAQRLIEAVPGRTLLGSTPKEIILSAQAFLRIGLERYSLASCKRAYEANTIHGEGADQLGLERHTFSEMIDIYSILLLISGRNEQASRS